MHMNYFEILSGKYINYEWILSLFLLLLKEQLVMQQNGGPRKVVMQLLSEKTPKN